MLFNRNKRRGWSLLLGAPRLPPGPLRYFFIAVRICVILLAIVWASGDKEFREMFAQMVEASQIMMEQVEKQTLQTKR